MAHEFKGSHTLYLRCEANVFEKLELLYMKSRASTEITQS